MSTHMSIHLTLVTPSQHMMWNDVAWLNLPGLKGRRGLLPQTAPEIVQLQEGILMFQENQGTSVTERTISQGFGHVYTHIDGYTCCDIMVDHVG